MTNSHQERVRIVDMIVRVCHEKLWNYDTPCLADKISLIAARMCYSQPAVKGLVYSVVERLKMEKEEAAVTGRILEMRSEQDVEAPAQ